MAPLLAGAIALTGCVSMEPGASPASSTLSSPASTASAWKDFDAGNLAASQATFERFTQEHPSDPAGHFGLGRVTLAQGHREEAIGHFQRAIALDNASAAHWAYLGTAQLQLEKNADAVASLQKALALDPKQGQALVAMAEYAMTVEVDYDKALHHLEQAKASGFTAIPPELEPAIRQKLN
jgi:tetratricopeptide (TPR) repeat protein